MAAFAGPPSCRCILELHVPPDIIESQHSLICSSAAGYPGHSTPEAELVDTGDIGAGRTPFCVSLIVKFVSLFLWYVPYVSIIIDVLLTGTHVEKLRKDKGYHPWWDHSTGVTNILLSP